jgi:hypothetical protein
MWHATQSGYYRSISESKQSKHAKLQVNRRLIIAIRKTSGTLYYYESIDVGYFFFTRDLINYQHGS